MQFLFGVVSGECPFFMPRNIVKMAVEIFTYRRTLGTTRIEGSIVLQEAGLRRTAQFPEKLPGLVMK